MAINIFGLHNKSKSIITNCWVDRSLEYGTSSDPFSCTISTDGGIIQSMMTKEEPWEDYHHRSHLLDHIEDIPNELNFPSVLDFLPNSIFIDIVNSEQNLSNIEETISIDISTKPRILENIHVGKSCSPLELETYRALFHEFHDIFGWSYEDMPDIDSRNMRLKCILMSCWYDNASVLFI